MPDVDGQITSSDALEGATERRLGRRVHLRPLRPTDYALFYEAELTPPDDVLYRHRGTTPSFESYPETLWRNVLAQFVVEDIADGRPVGLVAAYEPNLRDGHVRIAVNILLPYRGLGWPIDGLRLFINHIFYAFPMRKLYADVIEPNLDQFGEMFHGILHEEARFREHTFIRDRYVDLVVLALYRSEWEGTDWLRTGDSSLAEQMRIATALHSGVVTS